MLRLQRAFTIALAATALLGAAGCDEADDIVDPTDEGRVRAIHAIGNAPGVDVAIDGQVAVTNLPYKSKSDYATVEQGTRQVGVRATGTTTDLLTASPNVEDDTDYTIIAIGRMGATDGPTPRLLTIEEDADPASGQASVRVVHASPGAGNVDVYVTAPDDSIETATPVLTNLSFGQVVGPLEIAPGTYRVRVTPTGTKTVAIDINNLPVVAGKYLAVAVGDNAPGTGDPSPFEVLFFPENSDD